MMSRSVMKACWGVVRAALLLACLLPSPPMAAFDPFPVEVAATAPGGAQVWMRVAFRKGVQVETKALPKGFFGKPQEEGAAWMPFVDLSAEGKRWVLQSLWPQTEWRNGEVRHKVRWPKLESVWLLATLYTGHGQNYDQLVAANPDKDEKFQEGDSWQIPKSLLSSELGGEGSGQCERCQPEDTLDDEARVAAYRAMLTYGKDGGGAYAAYRLRKGEALYSSVVMRYTDTVDPKGVNELAQEIAQRSDIRDMHAIPPGTVIKIPVARLADPFQLEGTQALEEERTVRKEVRRTRKVDGGPRLRGVRIVLDPGHGGIDVGAIANGVWESDFVFDIAMRVQRRLQEETEAEVFATLDCPGLTQKVRDRIAHPCRMAHLLTTPPIPNDGEHPNAVSVHLRWVLANARFAQAKKENRQKTVFISLHADSLHPTARGSMIYVPGATAVPASFALGARRTLRVKEARLGSRISFSQQERLQGEARSRVLAEAMLHALDKQNIPIHANRPIRNVIHRARKSYLPAVIRHSTASSKILVEVGNLTNHKDALNLKRPAFRQRYADALVQGIMAYFGQ